MKINIGKFEIESDKNQFILYENRKKGVYAGRPNDIPDENETVREHIGYYSNLETCFKSLPGRAIMRSEITSVKECISEIRKYKQLIKEAMA